MFLPLSLLPPPSSTQTHTQPLRCGCAGVLGELGRLDLRRPSWKSTSAGVRAGLGGRKRCHPRAQVPHPHPARGCDRSLPLRPHYKGELLRLAEEPDGCGGGREASLAPWPGLNIYYVLFGLCGGKGGRIVSSIRSYRRGRDGSRGEGGAPAGAPRSLPGPARTQHSRTRPSRGGVCPLPSLWAALGLLC